MDKSLSGTSIYKASLTREQFLLHEMRTTANIIFYNSAGDAVFKALGAE